MQTLALILESRRDDVMQRWLTEVRGTLHPASMSRIELVDHLPAFLDHVIASLRREVTPGGADASAVAEDHGVQRLQLGFSLDQVVREYGALRTAMFAITSELDFNVSTREYQVIFDCVITGIAGAVSEYSRQRDAEMQRQATEHFAFVAHELRNPLSSSLLALTVLQASKQLDPEDRKVQIMERGLTSMRDLIDHSLRLARFGSGVDLQREPIRLRTLLEEARSAVALNAETKGIRLEVSLDGDDDNLDVDARLLRSALSNLVRNAIKFSHEHSVVCVRGKVANDRATIEIEDACGGLPASDLEKVFSPFVQLGASSTTGFGLGLAIARQAVDAHGGSLRVQNLPGKGCIFVLELPTSAPEPVPS